MMSRIQSKTKYAIKEKRKCDLNQEKKGNLQWLYSELTEMRCLNCYREGFIHAQKTKGNMLTINEQTGNFRKEFKTTKKKKKDQIGVLGWINMYIIY